MDAKLGGIAPVADLDFVMTLEDLGYSPKLALSAAIKLRELGYDTRAVMREARQKRIRLAAYTAELIRLSRQSDAPTTAPVREDSEPLPQVPKRNQP